jgi:hypothetical protein
MHLTSPVQSAFQPNTNPGRQTFSRVQRAHQATLFNILDMQPMTFAAFCWAMRVGAFTPSLKTCNIQTGGFTDGPEVLCGKPVVLEDGDTRYCAGCAKDFYEDGGILSPEAKERYDALVQ